MDGVMCGRQLRLGRGSQCKVSYQSCMILVDEWERRRFNYSQPIACAKKTMRWIFCLCAMGIYAPWR